MLPMPTPRYPNPERHKHFLKDFVIGHDPDDPKHALVMAAPTFHLDDPDAEEAFNDTMRSLGATPLSEIENLNDLPVSEAWRASIDKRGTKTVFHEGDLFYRANTPTIPDFIAAAALSGTMLLYLVNDVPEGEEIRTPFLLAQTDERKGFMVKMECYLFPGTRAQT